MFISAALDSKSSYTPGFCYVPEATKLLLIASDDLWARPWSPYGFYKAARELSFNPNLPAFTVSIASNGSMFLLFSSAKPQNSV